MRELLAAVSALLAAGVAAAGAPEPRDPISILPTAVGDFKVEPIDAFWTTSGVHVEAAAGLKVGTPEEPAWCFGSASHQFATDAEPAPDAVAEAQVNLGAGPGVRSVAIRIQRDNDPNQIVYARVTAWKETRNATVTKVRLRLGARIKETGNDIWWHEDRLDLDDEVVGTLKLVVQEKVATASYPGDLNPITQDKLENKGTFISRVCVEISGDNALLDPDPAMETFGAHWP